MPIPTETSIEASAGSFTPVYPTLVFAGSRKQHWTIVWLCALPRWRYDSTICYSLPCTIIAKKFVVASKTASNESLRFGNPLYFAGAPTATVHRAFLAHNACVTVSTVLGSLNPSNAGILVVTTALAVVDEEVGVQGLDDGSSSVGAAFSGIIARYRTTRRR